MPSSTKHAATAATPLREFARKRRPSAVATTPAGRGPQASGADDEEIARRARHALTERLGSAASSISLSADSGTITLDGHLDYGEQKLICQQVVAGMPGIGRVVNRIRVSPPSRLGSRTTIR